MRVAICTTTINIPTVLNLYAPFLDPDTRVFVAGDQKTPKEAYELVLSLGNSQVSLPESGHQWKCSELIGWNSIQRRNIAFLEALKWGADEIISIDDDNTPIDMTRYLYQFSHGRFDGLKATSKDRWFDPGRLLVPWARHRGFPHTVSNHVRYESASDVKIGVCAGLCLGDPDISAATRIATAPEINSVSEIAKGEGVAVDPNTWTVFNSQNTSVVRELIPAWGMVPFTGRYDDIFASLIVQRVARERNLHVRFGLPLAWQSRNEHDLVKDLRAEIDGMSNIERLADLLDHVQLAGKSVISDCRRIWETLNHADWMPGRSVSAMCAYLDDCEAVL